MLDNTFDLCIKCVKKHTKGHAISPPLPGRFVMPSEPRFVNVLQKKLQQHSYRKFIGSDLQSGKWKFTTYDEVYHQALSLATFFDRLLGPASEPRYISMSSGNRAEWVVADFAIAFGSNVSVPVHTTVEAGQLASMLIHSHTEIFICDTIQLAKLRTAVAEAGARLPIKHVIVMAATVAGEPGDTFALHAWPAATTIPAAEWSPVRPAKSGSDLRTLLYTSGSTGTPKAAMITDDLLMEDLVRVALYQPFVVFAFQPLAYSTQRVIMLETVGNGGRMCCWDTNMETFFEQLAATQISTFSAPPRVWNVLYSMYQAKVAMAEPPLPRDAETQEAVEKKVLQDILRMFGRNCMGVSTGGAPTSPIVLAWMQRLFKSTAVSVTEGYGITEVGTIAMNGVRVMQCQVHLEDVPEMGYLTTDKPRARGLLWVHTPSMALGYHGDVATTAANFQDIKHDGRLWFNTGDIVQFDPRLNDLVVIDRKKNFIKLAQSVFVAPEHIENVLISCPFVTNIWVYAVSAEDSVLAVVYPNKELFMHHAASQHLSFTSFGDLCAQPAATALMQRALAAEATKKLLPHEIPRGVLLEAQPWSPETGELTVSLKLARMPLTHKYRTRLAALYDRLAGRAAATVTSPSPNLADSESTQAAANIPVAPAGPAGSTGGHESGRGGAAKEDKRAQFAKVVSEVTNINASDLNWDSTLAECGLDSTAVVLLISLLKSHRIHVPWDRLYRSPLRDVADAIENDQGGSSRATVVDWAAECTLSPDLASLCASFVGRHAPPASPADCRVLLTGATGFLGAAILSELLQAGAHVVCVVRAVDDTAALKRILDAAVLFGTNDVVATGVGAARVTAFAGDLSLPQFGITESTFEALTSGLHAIVHNAARVNGVLPYAVLRSDNVQSTLTCLALATRAGAKLIYVSTLSSLCGLEQGEERSTPPSQAPLSLMSGYGATKRVSEILLHQAFAAGFKSCVIVRPGTIGPSLHAGCLSPGDTLTRLMQSMVQLQASPANASLAASVCSVTDIGLVCARLALDATMLLPTRSPAGCLPALNMSGPGVIAIADLGDVARAEGWPVEPVPLGDFLLRMRMVDSEKSCALKPIESYFAGSEFPLSVETCGQAAAMRVCHHLGVSRTALTTADFARAFRWLVDRGMLARPAKSLSTVTVVNGRRMLESWI